MSFVFLLLGTLVGFQAAAFYHPGRATGVLQDPYNISLSAAKEEKHLHVRWDRTAPPVRNAQHAVLTILDGQYKTDVKLDYAQLQNPSMFYKLTSNTVELRMEIFTKENSSVVETLVWKKQN